MYGYYRDEVADLEDAYEAHWDEPGYDWEEEEYIPLGGCGYDPEDERELAAANTEIPEYLKGEYSSLLATRSPFPTTDDIPF